MRDILNRFIDNTIGHFQEVSYEAAKYQCMDLAYEWVFVLRYPKATIQHQYAYEVYTKASDFTREYFDVIKNEKETIPEEGDLVVWNKTSSNIAGHIAIVIEATQTKMKVYEQNNPLGTSAHIQDRAYTNCLGFLRPKEVNVSNIPPYFKTLLQEQGLDLNNEGEFRSFWQKAKDYDQHINERDERIKSLAANVESCGTDIGALTEDNQKLRNKLTETEEALNQERDKFYQANKEKLECKAQVEVLQRQVDALTKELEQHEQSNDLYGYSWWRRFFSLFRR